MFEKIVSLRGTPRSEWTWMPHPAHLIVSFDCRFHLATEVGGFIVSTVGEYWPDRRVREIHAQVTDTKWFEENKYLKGDAFDDAYMSRFGFMEIGIGTNYETMVFRSPPCRRDYKG